jgi:hypothetical protein
MTLHCIWWHEDEHTQHDLNLNVEHDATDEEIRRRLTALCGAESDIHLTIERL